MTEPLPRRDEEVMRRGAARPGGRWRSCLGLDEDIAWKRIGAVEWERWRDGETCRSWRCKARDWGGWMMCACWREEFDRDCVWVKKTITWKRNCVLQRQQTYVSLPMTQKAHCLALETQEQSLQCHSLTKFPDPRIPTETTKRFPEDPRKPCPPALSLFLVVFKLHVKEREADVITDCCVTGETMGLVVTQVGTRNPSQPSRSHGEPGARRGLYSPHPSLLTSHYCFCRASVSRRDGLLLNGPDTLGAIVVTPLVLFLSWIRRLLNRLAPYECILRP